MASRIVFGHFVNDVDLTKYNVLSMSQCPRYRQVLNRDSVKYAWSDPEKSYGVRMKKKWRR